MPSSPIRQSEPAPAATAAPPVREPVTPRTNQRTGVDESAETTAARENLSRIQAHIEYLMSPQGRSEWIENYSATRTSEIRGSHPVPEGRAEGSAADRAGPERAKALLGVRAEAQAAYDKHLANYEQAYQRGDLSLNRLVQQEGTARRGGSGGSGATGAAALMNAASLERHRQATRELNAFKVEAEVELRKKAETRHSLEGLRKVLKDEEDRYQKNVDTSWREYEASVDQFNKAVDQERQIYDIDTDALTSRTNNAMSGANDYAKWVTEAFMKQASDRVSPQLLPVMAKLLVGQARAKGIYMNESDIMPKAGGPDFGPPDPFLAGQRALHDYADFQGERYPLPQTPTRPQPSSTLPGTFTPPERGPSLISQMQEQGPGYASALGEMRASLGPDFGYGPSMVDEEQYGPDIEWDEEDEEE